MPELLINGCKYHYDIYGQGEETIVFSHGLLWSSDMFHKQIDHLKDQFRIVAYDHRGQGRSEVTAGGYDMDQLYEDAVRLIEQLNLGKVHFAGLSMGGFVALRLGARRPDLVKSLILMETSAQEEPNKFKYGVLTTIVRIFGVKSVSKPVMKILFGEKFLNDPDRIDEREEWARRLTENKKSIVRAVSGVLHRKGVEDELASIKCPVLILVGSQDVATVPEKAEFMQTSIPNSTLVYIEGGGHTACIEEPEQYNRAIESFLATVA